jgi:glucose-6-phosphate 1-dehydrogenase
MTVTPPETPQSEAATLFVLYGATGDLAKRMVLPAFFSLFDKGLLPRQWRLVGNGRGDVSHEDFRGHVHDVLTEFAPPLDETRFEQFSQHLAFAGGGFDTDSPGSLLDVLAEQRKEIGADAQLIHYFAVPPTAFEELTQALGAHDLAKGARVVYEKPYGTSPEQFAHLDQVVHSILDESQVFRIDHFLGKEATQDLHVLRFGNTLFHRIWHREHVRAVQIDVPEVLDIDDRAEFYDHTGAFLDMIVTHLFQLAAEVAMEPPVSMAADDLQEAREGVIAAFRPLDVNDVVLGQYDGYQQVEGIDPNSQMDTYVAARLWIDTERWHGVPFYLRTGKRLAAGAQTVSLLLSPPDGPLTHLPPDGNVLTMVLDGSGKIEVTMVVKEPGAEFKLVDAEATLDLAKVADADPLAPYARLIHDVLAGDLSLFTRPDGLAQVWEVAKPVLDHRPEVHPYEAGSWGPAAAVDLIAPDRWLLGQ